MLPGSGNTCVLFWRRRKGAEKISRVVVTPKLRTVVVALSVFDFLSESLVGNELLPVHGRKGMKNMCTLARESKEKQVFLLLFPRLFVPLHIIL